MKNPTTMKRYHISAGQVQKKKIFRHWKGRKFIRVDGPIPSTPYKFTVPHILPEAHVRLILFLDSTQT